MRPCWDERRRRRAYSDPGAAAARGRASGGADGAIASIRSGAPHLIDGARSCPPEDCGGAPGYEHLLEVLVKPSHEEHDELLRWVGGEYDAEAFDLAETNANLELFDRLTRAGWAQR